MATATLAPRLVRKILASFPAADVVAVLRDELIEAVASEASISGGSLPSTPAEICRTPFQIDSLVVVSILCAVEPLLGIELPDSVVRTGGYNSVDHAIELLLPQIEAFWNKRKGRR